MGFYLYFFGDLGFVFLVISWGWGERYTHTHTYPTTPHKPEVQHERI